MRDGESVAGTTENLLKAAERLTRHPRRVVARTGLRTEAQLRGVSRSDLDRALLYADHGLRLRRAVYPHRDQRPWRFFPEIESKPVWHPSDFEWLTPFEAAYGEILAEYRQARHGGDLPAHHQKLNDAGSWNVLYFFAGGRRFDDNHAKCPVTSELLNNVPGIGEAGQAYFSILAPRTHIPAHGGPTNTRLRCHLGLEVPVGARIRVSDQTLTWTEGEWIVFDDSFDHEVWVDSDQHRAVLIIDTWHPDLTQTERKALRRIDPLLGASLYGTKAKDGSTSRWRPRNRWG